MPCFQLRYGSYLDIVSVANVQSTCGAPLDEAMASREKKFMPWKHTDQASRITK